MGLVTHRHHAGVRLADAAAVVLLPGHGDSEVLHCTALHCSAPADIVDDVLLLLVGPGPGSGAQLVVHRADDVQLVVLPRQVTCKYQYSNA